MNHQADALPVSRLIEARQTQQRRHVVEKRDHPAVFVLKWILLLTVAGGVVSFLMH